MERDHVVLSAFDDFFRLENAGIEIDCSLCSPPKHEEVSWQVDNL